MSMPSLGSLRVLEAAVRCGSFANAAKELNLSPSAVSHRVRSLEAFYGFPLFLRNGRRDVVPTADCVSLAAVVAGAIKAVQAESDALLLSRKRGLTVSALPSFAARWLLPRLGAFVARHPDVDITVRSTTSHADFSREKVDLAIRFGGGTWDGVDAAYLMGDALFPVCSPQFLQAFGPLETPEDMMNAEWIEGDPQAWERWFKASGRMLPLRKRRLDLGDANNALQAAISGAGIVVTRQSIAERDIADGRLIRLAPGVKARSQFSYYLVKPDGVTLSAQAQLFEDWLRGSIGQSG